MNHSFRVGFSFGLTSAIITTLGLMVGLSSGTNSKLAVVGGILTIAIADAFSDSLGIHVSEESENRHSKEIWSSTFSTFVSKFLFALTFLVPVILFDLALAVAVSIVWGLFSLSVLSYKIATDRKKDPWKAIGEHLSIAVIVVIVTHYLGIMISVIFF